MLLKTDSISINTIQKENAYDPLHNSQQMMIRVRFSKKLSIKITETSDGSIFLLEVNTEERCLMFVGKLTTIFKITTNTHFL